MPLPESSPINSYLNPEYWDGRMIGQPTPDAVTRQFSGGQSRFADKAVAAYLANRRAPYPLTAFANGDVIDANDHEPGTIFYANREALSVRGPLGIGYDPTVEEAMPEPPVDKGFELTELDLSSKYPNMLEGLERAHMIYEDNIRYAALRSFIIVTRGRRSKNNLQHTQPSH